MRLPPLALVSLVACTGEPPPAPPVLPKEATSPPLALWSQLVDPRSGHHVEARWVLDGAGARCAEYTLRDGPRHLVGGERVASPPPASFDVTVCAVALPDDLASATLEQAGRPLGSVQGWAAVLAAVEAGRPVIALGDTGCRDDSQQSCDADHWGLPGVLQGTAAESPALYLHVGDYRYRGEEASTPDSWSAWNDDFMSLLDAQGRGAPWVLGRGNHEQCAPNSPTYGAAWWWLFGPTAQTTCPSADDDLHPTWSFDLPRGSAVHRFVVIDSSNDGSAVLQSRLADALGLSLTGQYTRWIHHHPLLGLLDFRMPQPADPEVRQAFELALAGARGAAPLCAQGRCDPAADIVGHEHFYERVRFRAQGGTADVWPQTLIVGHGGVVLRSAGADTPDCLAPLTVTPAGGAARTWSAELESAAAFGYVAIALASDTATAEGWTLRPVFTGTGAPSAGTAAGPCTTGGNPMSWSTEIPTGGALGFPAK